MWAEFNVSQRYRTWLEAMPGPAPDDPTVPLLMNDNAEIARIGPDGKQIRRALRWDCCIQSPFMLPCFILTGMPCKLWCGDSYDKYAEGRRLILYEKNLVYQLDSTALRPPPHSLCSDEMVNYSLNISLLLDDNFQVKKVKWPGFCYSVFMLEIEVDGKLIAVLDSPKDVDRFLEQVHAQVVVASSKPSNEMSPLLKEIHRVTLDYYKFIVSIPLGGGGVEEYESLVRFQAGVFYENLNRELNILRERANGHMPIASNAPLIAEMVRDEVPAMRSIALMTSNEVHGVLAELGLQTYSANFEKAGVDGGMLSVMDDSSLSELGVSSSLDRKRILGWIANQKALLNTIQGGSSLQ